MNAGARGAGVSLRVDFDGVDDLVAEFDRSLATGRAFFATDREHAIGAPIRLTSTVPGLREPIVVDGTVVDTGAAHGDEAGIVVELDAASRASLAALVERVRRGDPAVLQRTIRVLLVEDNQHVTELLRSGLRKANDGIVYVLGTAPDGREALAMMSTGHWDLAIVDMYLPVLDGAELIRRARAAPALRDLPIIAVSAGGQAARRAAVEAGASAYIDKPVRLRQVIELLREHGSR